MDLILFGMQGSGKGTVGKALGTKYNAKVFETGAELRKLSQEDSELARKVKAIMEAGQLVPNEVVMEIVENFMNNSDPETPIIFDGIPRKIEQAESLNTLLDKYDRNYKAVLLEIAKDTALKRLTTRRICKACKAVYPANYEGENCAKCEGELVTRSDDNPEAIEARLAVFEKETLPAMELYQDRLIKIDGEPSIEVVQENAFEILKPIMEQE